MVEEYGIYEHLCMSAYSSSHEHQLSKTTVLMFMSTDSPPSTDCFLTVSLYWLLKAAPKSQHFCTNLSTSFRTESCPRPDKDVIA